MKKVSSRDRHGAGCPGECVMDDGVNVLALVKNGERFVFLYDDESAPKLLQTFGKYAADPELEFSWYDAAVMSQRVRALQREQANEAASQLRRAG